MERPAHARSAGRAPALVLRREVSRLPPRAATARRPARTDHAADRRARVRRPAPGDRAWATARRSRGCVREEGFTLRRWFCGLPSATPYCQAGNLPRRERRAFPPSASTTRRRGASSRATRRTACSTSATASTRPGALAGGSSYVNLLDGDAQTVAFTVATRERMSVFRRLGGTRMALLIAAPSRSACCAWSFRRCVEWLREEWERARRRAGAARVTHAKEFFRSFAFSATSSCASCRRWRSCSTSTSACRSSTARSCSTTSSAHHFGPSSLRRLRDLRRTDARIGEIRRMIAQQRAAAVRPRDPLATTG